MTTEEFSSYPPLFLESNHQEIPNLNNQSHGPSEPPPDAVLPVIDHQDLNLMDLDQACRDWGAFLLVNHGIPSSLINQLTEQTKKVFSLPFQSKQTRFKHPISYFWGNPIVEEAMTAEEMTRNLNWVEGLTVFRNQLQQSESEDPMFESYRCLIQEYGTHMDRICVSLFAALAKKLGLDSAQMENSLSFGESMLRAYRYPRCSKPREVPGFFVHTDNTVITILHRGEARGLEVLKDDTWLDVKPVADALVIILGDMMQAISGDEYKAITHKVSASENEDKCTIAYFSVPKPDAVIQNSKYRPFTFLEFLAVAGRIFKATRRKGGLETFKIVGDGDGDGDASPSSSILT